MSASVSQPSDQFCLFHVRNEAFAISATEVREIVEMTPIVSVPHSPSCLAGLCHAHNEFVPVLLLSPFLTEAAADHIGLSLLIIMDSPQGAWALAISQIAGLDRLEPAMTGGADSPVVIGTANWRNKVVRILDVDRLFCEAAESIDQAWSSLAISDGFANDLSIAANAQTVS